MNKKNVLTRIGENSKLVVNGDPQIDLINKSSSGLIKSKNILEFERNRMIEFDHNDVVRHPLVSKIIEHTRKKY